MLTNFLEKIGRKRNIMDRSGETLYLERYYLLFTERQSKFKSFPFNVLLHHLCKSDDPVFHDHPWFWCSIIIKGGYWEHTPDGKKWYGKGSIRFRDAKSLHWLELDPEKSKEETWSIFIVGLRTREWGFLVDGKWVHWKEYLK